MPGTKETDRLQSSHHPTINPTTKQPIRVNPKILIFIIPKFPFNFPTVEMLGDHSSPSSLLEWVDQNTPRVLQRANADAMLNGMITGFEILDELEPEPSIISANSQFGEYESLAGNFFEPFWPSPMDLCGIPPIDSEERLIEFPKLEGPHIVSPSIEAALVSGCGSWAGSPVVPKVAATHSTGVHEATFPTDQEQQGQNDSQGPGQGFTKHTSGVTRISSNFQAAFEVAWNDLRCLRRYFVRSYRKMRRIARKFNSTALSRLLKTVRGPKGLSNRGILTFKDVIRGTVPDDLLNIFALLAMSYAMSKILVTKDKIKPADVLSGLNLWRDVICDSEREDFCQLAESLWPEAKTQLQAQNRPGGSNFDGLGVDFGSVTNAFTKSQIWASTMDRAGVWVENLHFQDLSAENYSHPGATPLPGDLHSMKAFSTGSGYAGPPDIPSVESVLHQCDEAGPYVDPQLISLIDPRTAAAKQKTQRPSIEALHETSVFQVVYAFADGEIFDLLFILSGKGATVRYYRRAFCMDQDQRMFEMKVTEEAFAQLRRGDSPEIPGLQALVSAAETFVSLACLRSLDQVREFVLEVAQVSSFVQ